MFVLPPACVCVLLSGACLCCGWKKDLQRAKGRVCSLPPTIHLPSHSPAAPPSLVSRQPFPWMPPLPLPTLPGRHRPPQPSGHLTARPGGPWAGGRPHPRSTPPPAGPAASPAAAQGPRRGGGGGGTTHTTAYVVMYYIYVTCHKCYICMCHTYAIHIYVSQIHT